MIFIGFFCSFFFLNIYFLKVIGFFFVCSWVRYHLLSYWNLPEICCTHMENITNQFLTFFHPLFLNSTSHLPFELYPLMHWIEKEFGHRPMIGLTAQSEAFVKKRKEKITPMYATSHVIEITSYIPSTITSIKFAQFVIQSGFID